MTEHGDAVVHATRALGSELSNLVHVGGLAGVRSQTADLSPHCG